MNKTILTIILAFTMLMTNATSSLLSSNSKTSIYSGNVINIKLKNDTDEAFSVINAGSGGSYRLSKNTVVTIKMEEGDKLYMYYVIVFRAAKAGRRQKRCFVTGGFFRDGWQSTTGKQIINQTYF
jgi:hypothetical protein